MARTRIDLLEEQNLNLRLEVKALKKKLKEQADFEKYKNFFELTAEEVPSKLNNIKDSLLKVRENLEKAIANNKEFYK